jgi:hypothetical protein
MSKHGGRHGGDHDRFERVVVATQVQTVVTTTTVNNVTTTTTDTHD